MYTAILQVIVYQLAKYEKDPMKNDRETEYADSGKEIKEKTKKNKQERKDNTTTERSSDFIGRP